ncbi:DUF2663 family protein [Fictibacillus aquaticus]|nr:DUF2663 family protein [Fictibacillus aquaticus]
MENFNEYKTIVPDATKQMLTVLIQKKSEKEKWKSMQNTWGFSLMFIILLLFAYVSFSSGNGKSVSALRSMFSDPVVWLCGFFCLLSGFQLLILKKKYGKADDEYESARRDFIDRNEEWWTEKEQWDNRHVVMEYMKKEYNINVLHK